MRSRQSGFSLIELLIVVAIILIIAAIAIPDLMKSKMAGNEASAVGSLRQYVTACISYSNTNPNQGYPANLSLIGPAGEGLVDAVLAPAGGGSTASKSGYNFTYAPGPADASGRINSFTFDARPVAYDKTGKRSFFLNDEGVIRFTTANQAATVTDPPI